MKRIGVVTSGGDCPGLNPCIRSVVRTAIGAGLEIVGVQRGWRGLLEENFVALDSRSVSGIVHRGGTILLSSRCPEFRDAEHRQRGIAALERRGIEGLVVLGGNGSLEGAWHLSREGKIPVIGVPKTIDNDVGGTDYALGFDTAVNTAMAAIDKIHDTATSHERVFLVEVMGRNRGFLALEVALACGAEDVLVPEVPTDLEALCARLAEYRAAGKTSSIIVVAEGNRTGNTYQIARQLKEIAGYEPRVSVLGYLQRGGSPTARDRVLGGLFGKRAVEALVAGERTRMVAWSGRVDLADLELAWSEKRPLDPDRLALTRALAR